MAEKKTTGIKKTEIKAKDTPKETKPIEKKVVKKVEKKEAPKKEVKKEKTYTISRSKESSAQAREKSRLEKKKGKFKRQNYGKKLRVPDKWHRPRGIDSGHREDEKHKPAHPRPGYITPMRVKGLDVTGYKPIRVLNVTGLDGIEPKTEAIIIASCVGMKKRKDIQKIAQEKKIQVLNYKE